MKSSHTIGVLSVCTHNSKELCRSVRKPRPRTRSSQKSFKTSSSDEENGHTTSVLSEYPLTMSSSKLLVYFTVFPGRCREEFTEYFACFNLIYSMLKIKLKVKKMFIFFLAYFSVILFFNIIMCIKKKKFCTRVTDHVGISVLTQFETGFVKILFSYLIQTHCIFQL